MKKHSQPESYKTSNLRVVGLRSGANIFQLDRHFCKYSIIDTKEHRVLKPSLNDFAVHFYGANVLLMSPRVFDPSPRPFWPRSFQWKPGVLWVNSAELIGSNRDGSYLGLHFAKLDATELRWMNWIWDATVITQWHSIWPYLNGVSYPLVPNTKKKLRKPNRFCSLETICVHWLHW